ncbi:MAG: GNAT family N-acetyltransferase [Treponema sp.]|nr:GNAT family N-acetyltransferase [Treponema sp.]
MKWQKMAQSEYRKAEAFLRKRETFCVAASARFLRLGESRGHVWYLPGHGEDGGRAGVSALLLHCRRTLFPVFGKTPRVPGPRFLSRFLGKVPIHAIQGLKEDTEILETLMQAQGYFAAERIDYSLMSLDSVPLPQPHRAGPAGLALRSPVPEDEESLFALQSAYEQEEVLPANSSYNPAATRLNLRHILSREQVLVAALDGRVVGKINTSAKSFTRYQIGGVYVRCDCRGLGIGAMMTTVFARSLLAQGRGLTLFVKKRNAAACKVYRKAGFAALADYRITYY